MTLKAGFFKWTKEERASTSVEFAMIGLGFILLMVSVIEFGRYAWTSNVVDYAVDEAARYAVLHQSASSSEVENFARSTLDSLFVPPSSLTINVANTSSAGVDFVEISGSYGFTSLTSGILPASLSEVTLDISSRRPIYIYDEDAAP